jgi:hypothetical protein
MPKSSQGGHSAQVKMKLLVNGSSILVAQMGADFLLVTDDCPQMMSNLSVPPG